MNQTTIHPLLSSSPTEPTSQLTTTTTTTSTTSTTSAANHQQQQELTDALLFQNLRANAQELGLDGHSLGWNIIQTIHQQEHQLIERLQAKQLELLLLLPKTKTTNNNQLIINKQLILNHILIISPSSSSSNQHQITNLNGWNGLIEADRILFTSPGNPINPDLSFTTIKPSTSLSDELTSPAQLRFPIYHLLSPPAKTITIPRSNNTNTNNRSSSTSTAQRLASLFASSSRSESEPLTIQIRLIDRPLDSLELDQAITRAVSNRIKDGLGSLEENMLNTIQNFISRLSIYNHSATGGISSSVIEEFSSISATSSLQLATNQEIGEVIQEMYHEIDQQLEREYHQELEQDQAEEETRMIIDHTLELIEEVVCLELYDRFFEQSSLEDQQLTEKIAQLNLLDLTLDHLGLDLERREMDDPDGIITIRNGLDEIIKTASIELSRLEDGECRSPRDKVGVYVTVHKLIVDGLSSLPPIPMKKEGIPAGVITAGQLSQDQSINSNEVEMSHTLDRTGIPTDTTTTTTTMMMDRTLPMSTPLRPLPKDQASASELLDAMHTSLIDDPPGPPASAPPAQDLHPRSPDPAKLNKPRPNSSSADLILPILIYLIIKANPNRLISNLNYVNRFRYQRLIKGETDYCLVNFSVSCEFIKNFVGLDGSENFQSQQSMTIPAVAGRSVEQAEGSTSRGRAGYGTFPSPIKRGREKTGNSEVEVALIAASRAVGGVLMGGYQKVISSSLLDGSAAKLGLVAGGGGVARSAPRTLEDVKKLIGSGVAGRREAGNSGGGWGTRVGLLRRHQSSTTVTPDGDPLVDSPSSLASNPVKRFSSLFHTNNQPASLLSAPPVSSTLLPPTSSASVSASDLGEDDKGSSSIGQRLSHLSGFRKLQTHQSSALLPSKSHESLTLRPSLNEESVGAACGTDMIDDEEHRTAQQSGPIERLERCVNSDQLMLSDVPLLLADYQRLARIGRRAGLW
ncbi:uncharacterized protein PGTG_08299 [Puccinia graminis f. sp. tritici CRL 75-36-700-3]|uniref:VPS9 domain-containing protein n=1 Tax=Puccinia graminis f. sp. tritici (strain CRL 75-36-700-3 / race SCCL) TaxID=418459 RepID=E3KDW8_PUCGT|nr:uncharacterized protein PGTG_08299 [Puccinia graminis f. sp. tritici CRL 75-36-700-3]EFP82343.2 hypothetical protein PGTG_08299 [Puccinia graminis f. sp. tritici CRL 75-36-700-3]